MLLNHTFFIERTRPFLLLLIRPLIVTIELVSFQGAIFSYRICSRLVFASYGRSGLRPCFFPSSASVINP